MTDDPEGSVVYLCQQNACFVHALRRVMTNDLTKHVATIMELEEAKKKKK